MYRITEAAAHAADDPVIIACAAIGDPTARELIKRAAEAYRSPSRKRSVRGPGSLMKHA
jgi:hypothetical protein